VGSSPVNTAPRKPLGRGAAAPAGAPLGGRPAHGRDLLRGLARPPHKRLTGPWQRISGFVLATSSILGPGPRPSTSDKGKGAIGPVDQERQVEHSCAWIFIDVLGQPGPKLQRLWPLMSKARICSALACGHSRGFVGELHHDRLPARLLDLRLIHHRPNCPPADENYSPRRRARFLGGVKVATLPCWI